MKGIFIANKIHGVLSSLPHKFIIHTWRAQIEMDRNHKNREMKKTWKIKKCLIISVAKKIKIRKTVCFVCKYDCNVGEWQVKCYY